MARMARRADEQRVAEALALLDGRRLEERVGDTFILCTTDADCWPHIALLSAGEVLAHEDGEIRLALWPNTAATRNLTANGRALLAIIGRRRCLYLRLDCRRGPDIRPVSGLLASFAGRIERAMEDEVGYALITSGVRFDVHDEPKIVDGWARTVAALRALMSEQDGDSRSVRLDDGTRPRGR
jgi:hypothetical protein